MKWQKISGYDNYSVSDNGQVRNDNTGRILKQYIQRTGYCQVTLSKNCERKTYLVHRLVMKAFSTNPDPNIYKDVNHKDYNKSNNSIENLEWMRHIDNIKWGTVPADINEIGNEIKDAVVNILKKYIKFDEQYTNNLGEKLKNASTNSLVYMQRNIDK